MLLKDISHSHPAVLPPKQEKKPNEQNKYATDTAALERT